MVASKIDSFQEQQVTHENWENYMDNISQQVRCEGRSSTGGCDYKHLHYKGEAARELLFQQQVTFSVTNR